MNDTTFQDEEMTVEMIQQAEKIIGLQFTDDQRKKMIEKLNDYKCSYQKIRELHMKNDIPLSLYFNPIPPGKTFSIEKKPFTFSKVTATMPHRIEDVAFWPVIKLANLIETQQVTSTELTEMYLARLKKYDPVLKCVVTLTEDLALEQAHRADKEIARGNYKGLLHGIPWGVKDLFATKRYKTTWGAVPYKDQIIDADATVVKRLEQAGAVLVAKLSVGELATGDKWFGGQTRNPWKPEWGSGGSSAGPASAVAAGLVGFSIGTETTGSLIGPSGVCGATGLRPTFGRVSRYGVMTVSWTMDKVGPICRSAEDCAIVFNSIYGPDNIDHSVIDLPFNWNHVDITTLRVGYVDDYLNCEPKDEFHGFRLDSYRDALKRLDSMGVKLIPMKEPDAHWDWVQFILGVEAAAASDELTLSKRDELLTKTDWAEAFRRCRFVPAVEYIQANRARTVLIQKIDKIFEEVDVIVGSFILFSNVTGHPEVVIPNGFNTYGTPTSISFTGKLFGEAEILALAHAYQKITDYHYSHPTLDT